MFETAATIVRALRLTHAFGRACTASEFASAMWPDSNCWEHAPKRMNSAGSAFLGRLRRYGLVERANYAWRLSPAGFDYLCRAGGGCMGSGFPVLPYATVRCRDGSEMSVTVQGFDGSEMFVYTDGRRWFIWDGFSYLPYAREAFPVHSGPLPRDRVSA